jgi:uncharacterized protein
MDPNVTLVWILGIVLVVLGIAGIFLPALPSTPLVFAGLAAIAWIGDFQRVGVPTLISLAAITAMSYLIEFAAVSVGVRRFGATRKAGWGAVAGMIIGLFFGVPGLLLGPFLGAFIGELMSLKDLRQAGVAGVGAWLGLVLGTLLKLALAFTMIGVFILAYFL